ncbi:MAG: amidase domain-containing protein [Oscillospiraceae bacterium]|nr:amidase domain-containing protein [Oscillospiraceae bacterium]
MIKRFILAISVALILVGGLVLLLFFGKSNTFFGLIDKAIDDELFKPARKTAVNVNVYEVTNAVNPQLTFNNLFDDDPDLENMLKRYFTEYNNALGSLTELTENKGLLTEMYERHSVSMNIDFLILERQFQTRKTARLDLRFEVCDIGLQLTSVNFGANDFVEIRVTECFAAVFDGIENKLSSYSDVEHFFVLDKRSGSWLIKRHESNSALSVYINGELEKLVQADGHSLSELDALSIGDYVAHLRTVLDRETYYYTPEDAIEGATDEAFDNGEPTEEGQQLPEYTLYMYDRVAALRYADKFTNRERARRNFDFPEFERNGTNFTSQCINAGGIPFADLWKGIDAGLSSLENWANGSRFYEYIISPDSHISANVCSYSEAEDADIVQFINGGGEAIHGVIITDSVGGKEFLVAGNSEELKNFPLSALGFDIMRIIKINGYYSYNNTDENI